MADVQQNGGPGNMAAAQARLASAVALAEWANQGPSAPEPQTAAMTFSEVLSKVLGELARIMACYELREAINSYQDNQVMSGNEDSTLYDQAKEHADEAYKVLNCPPMR